MTIGKTSTGASIAISDEERRRHIYITGATGTGKSNLLSCMMRDDLAHDRPFALLDPHGDLAVYVANSIPKPLIERVLYFDPLDTHVVGYNPIKDIPIGQRSQLASDILSTFRSRWSDSWGPRMSYILGHAIRLLLDNDATLLSLPVLLTDHRYRERLLRRSTDPFNRRFWEEEYANYQERFRLDAIAPIQNKAGIFSADSTLRAVVGQRSAIDIPELMNSRRYLVANLNKAMGDEPSSLLGSFLTTAFAQGAQARSTIPQSERQDFTLYVDEFQNFATTSFTSILSEARKYRLNLVVANQFLSQIPEELRRAVLGNVSTLIVFRVSAEDAKLLAPELGHPNPASIAGTPYFNAWVRRGNESPMLVATDPAPAPFERLRKVLKRTRAKHGVSRAAVEKQVSRFIETG